MKLRMTKQELYNSSELYITPTDVVSLIGGDAQLIRIQAREGRLNYPTELRGNRVKVLRKEFISYLERL